jgi:hypothetical protein
MPKKKPKPKPTLTQTRKKMLTRAKAAQSKSSNPASFNSLIDWLSGKTKKTKKGGKK